MFVILISLEPVLDDRELRRNTRDCIVKLQCQKDFKESKKTQIEL